jgi:hypothetical protein
MRRKRKRIDPDLTRRDEAPYWAAALVLAIRAGDASRADKARSELERLGVNLATCGAIHNRARKGAGNER